MWGSGMKLPVSTLASLAILLAASGCADFHLPRIDPSGEHLFICDSPPPAAVPCPPGTVPAPAPAAPAAIAPAPIAAVLANQPPVVAPPVVSPYSDVAVMLSPFRTVQPVGSQLVLLGGVRGGDGYLRTNRRLEWWLMPGSVGQFTGIGEKSFSDFLVGDFTQPRVISATSAVGNTTRVDQWVGGPGNKVHVARGQGWVTVSSPVEGVSKVTVVAPDVVLPTERTTSATIYWIDAQFGLPTPAIIPAGSKQSLTTTVWRQSNHCPRPGWIVRYETVCGPPAVFGPTGTPSIEVPTNEAGLGSVEIVQRDPSPGTNQVRVQVFRPADSCGQRLMVREGSVLVTWTAPSLGIRQMGPPTATVGETITYRIEVNNPGDLPARDVVATEEVPDGLSFLQANPAPVVEGRRLQWRLGDLAPRQQQIIEATFRTVQPGVVAHCIDVTGTGGLRSSHCANTNVLAAMPGPATIPKPATIPGPATTPAPGPGPTSPRPSPARAANSVLELTVTPPAQAVVGSKVTFNIVLGNRGPVPATGIEIRDTFGDGLELENQQRSPFTGRLGDLAPGQGEKFALVFRVTGPGRLCHHVEATAADGARAAADSCVTAIAAGPPAVPAPPTPPATIPGRLEVFVDNFNKVAAGKNQQFLVQITNQDDYPESDIVVTARIPSGSAAAGASGPSADISSQIEQGSVRFSPVANLPPKAKLNYRVVVTTSRPGPISLRVEATSRRQTQPAVGEKTVEVLPAE